MTLRHGYTDPGYAGLYCAMVRGDWKLLEWDTVKEVWLYPGTDYTWQLSDVSQWFGPLPTAQGYDL